MRSSWTPRAVLGQLVHLKVKGRRFCPGFKGATASASVVCISMVCVNAGAVLLNNSSFSLVRCHWAVFATSCNSAGIIHLGAAEVSPCNRRWRLRAAVGYLVSAGISQSQWRHFQPSHRFDGAEVP